MDEGRDKSEEKQPKAPSIDEILARCGDFHRYQFVLLAFFCLVNILCSMHYYSQTIISFIPEHWCYSDSLANSSVAEIRQLAASSSNVDMSCRSFRFKSDDEANSSNNVDSPSISSECNQWIFNYDLFYGYQSMTGELEWVCQHAWKSVIGQSTYFIGSVVGTLVLGICADILGRLPVLIIAHLAGIIGNCLTIFANDEILFAIARFISGIATDSNFVMMYILVLEYIAPRMRTIGLNLCIGIFYCLGSVVSPWIAVWLGNWKLYLMATILPALVVPLFYFILPESAQWLIANKKTEKALGCYQKIAKFNRIELDERFMRDFERCADDIIARRKLESANPNLIDLFKTPRLRKLTLILFFKSMIITLGYDAISKNVEGLGLSPFILFSLSASAIFPACLLLLLLQDRIGRKAMASSSLLVSGFFTATAGIVIAYQQHLDPTLIAALSVMGRFGVTIAYNSGAQYATELIPTCVRGQGVSAVHVAGYALTFFSPYILYSATLFKALPSLILGGLSLMGAFCCLFLPETLNRKIPVTLQDGEEFGRGEKFYHFACFVDEGKGEDVQDKKMKTDIKSAN